ncbi:MAG: hypothetical protein AMS19_01645 [Gemmatimonas sp. SG8_23]|nr:MAG: hypothetical protein AMS19_01645 [Gemmatimonas sp. SG8_23]
MSRPGSEPHLRSPRFEWAPALLVGASAGLAAEVALGVLLYGGTGFMRSLTTILATEGLAFAGGLWTAPRPDPSLVDRLRRRWLFCLMSFLLATVFGAAWSLVPMLGEDALGQGLGLAVLAGLPLYGAGALLGGMSVAAESDPGSRLSSPAAPASVGAAGGFILTAFLLPLAPMPGSLLVACLVMLSAGGMLYGEVLNFRTEREVRARRSTATGEVRVEEVRLPAADVAERTLVDHEYVRLRRPLDVEPERPWDVRAWRDFMASLEHPVRVLIVGGGASLAPRAILREHPGSTVEVLERTPAAVELGREFFGTELTIGTDDRLSVKVGNLDDLIAATEPSHDLILVDTAALGRVGGRAGLSAASVARIEALLAPGGVVRWGGDAESPDVEGIA